MGQTAPPQGCGLGQPGQTCAFPETRHTDLRGWTPPADHPGAHRGSLPGDAVDRITVVIGLTPVRPFTTLTGVWRSLAARGTLNEIQAASLLVPPAEARAVAMEQRRPGAASVLLRQLEAAGGAGNWTGPVGSAYWTEFAQMRRPEQSAQATRHQQAAKADGQLDRRPPSRSEAAVPGAALSGRCVGAARE